MASATYDLVRAALIARQSIKADYDGHQRDLTPHVIGWNKGGGEQALFFQWGGGSASGLPAGGMWRCLPLDGMTNVARQPGWYVGTSKGIRPQSCVVTIDVSSEQ